MIEQSYSIVIILNLHEILRYILNERIGFVIYGGMGNPLSRPSARLSARAAIPRGPAAQRRLVPDAPRLRL